MLMLNVWLVLATVFATTWAQIQFTKPASGAPATLRDGKLLIQWLPSDSKELGAYEIQLWAGGDSEDTAGQVASAEGATPLSEGASSDSLPVPKGAGPLATNAYFLKMLVTTSEGQTAQFYSDRFSIAGMNGAFPGSASGKSSAEVEEAYRMVKTDITAVPQQLAGRQVAPAAPVPPADPAAATAGDAPAYSLQTAGNMKTAPMQQQPGTTITAQNTDPLYPTTAYNLARSALPIPEFVTTQTLPRTWATSSIENQASAATQPADDMAKYLARWKD